MTVYSAELVPPNATLAKWLSANDTGTTGSHQAGFHIPKSAWSMFFDRPGVDGEQFDTYIHIQWEGFGKTESRVTWYGRETRSEYRLTRFGRGFPFRGEEHVGSLLVLDRLEPGRYRAQVLSTDDAIDAFLGDHGLSPGDIGGGLLLEVGSPPISDCLEEGSHAALVAHDDFPSTVTMAQLAREAARRCLGVTAATPDAAIVDWTHVEFQLFRAFEERAVAIELGSNPVLHAERLIDLALPVINRRKARAGRSLEHHFAAILNHAGVPYTPQARTEGTDTMDFMFPSEAAYHDTSWPTSKLVACGAKTSVKERWRQVLNEADRCETKHLLTLQPIALSTVQQMRDAGLELVVPKGLQAGFGRQAARLVHSVEEFIAHVRATVLN